MQIHEYDEPALGQRRERRAKATATQSIMAVRTSSESGENAPAEATIGPMVAARLYAGPIAAEESTERSNNDSTFGSLRTGIGKVDYARLETELMQRAFVIRWADVLPTLA